jgi:short-subunit dehydrogenase
MGQVYGVMAALPHLKREGRGALIHISSVEAKRSFPFHSAYGASKQGIDGFLEALRVELRHEGWPISVTQVMPGTINTPFFDKGRTKLGVKPVGVPPVYEPETVANIILYAAEDPVRDLVSGGAAQALILNQRLSPRVLDAILVTRAGFSPQETEEPRSEDDVQPMCNVSGSERMLLTPWGVENRVSGTFLPLDRADAIAVAAKKEATRSSTPSSRRRNGSGNTNPKRRFT